MRKFAKYFGIIGAMIVVGFMTINLLAYDREQSRSRKLVKLTEELAILRQIRDSVNNQIIPDSLKNVWESTYCLSRYREFTGEDYWKAMRKIRESRECIQKNSKPLMYVQKMIDQKQKEIFELQ